MRPSIRRGFIIAVAATLATNLVPPTPTSAADPLTGKLVWMHYDQAQGDSDIWVMNADGSDQHALTTNAINESNPMWSPDGSRIAFTSARDGNQTDVYVMDEDGTNVQRLTQGLGDFQIGAWSPTANELVGTQTGESGHFLVLIDTETAAVTQLRSYEDGYSTGSFSPDGSQILVSLFRADDPEVGGSDLWTVDHSGAATRITDTPYPMDEMGATWSPDGSRIAFFANVDESDSEILVMDADGTDVTQLTDNDAYDETPTWSPDSASIAFNTGRADEFGDKWVMKADGSEQRPLVELAGGEGSADWTTGVIAPLRAPETVFGTIPAEGSLTTSDGIEPDIANPTDTTVTAPFGGDVTITESDQTTQSPPDDYFFIGQQVSITAVTDPVTTAENPLQVTFTLDRSLIPQTVADAAEVLVFRDGLLVEPCSPADGEPPATPDPCVLTTFYSGDLDVTIVVLTSSASDWSFGLAPPFEPPPPDPPESVTGEIAPGGMLTTDWELDGVTLEDVLETTVTTSPDGDAGTVTITEITEGVGVAGPDFTFLDVFPSIEAPDGTADSPLVVEFLIHSSRMPSIPLEELRVLRHGVPIERCDPDAGDAAIPEPCVATQEFTGTGDVRIVVRTAQVSGLTWLFGYNLPPEILGIVTSSVLPTTDHVILVVSEEIDPTSIPAPSDFEIVVDSAPVTESGVRLLYQGLRGFEIAPGIVFSEGVALLMVSWDEAVASPGEISLGYTPGTRPIQDSSGNEAPATGDDLIAGGFDPDLDIAIVDDTPGPNHVVFLTQPLDPDLPAASDFRVTIEGEEVVPETVTLRHPEVGMGILDFTLSQPIESWQTVSLSYVGATPFLRLDGQPVVVLPVDVFVNLSGTPPGSTPESEPAGTPVSVTFHDFLGNGATTLDLTFSSVDLGGETTFFSLDPAEVPPPGANFEAGGAFYEIDTTAEFTPPVEICLTYDEGAYEDESAIALIHFEDPNWIDVTTLLDQDANRVCGSVDSFSPFGVVESRDPAFAFAGFFKPVDNGGVLNLVSAGRAVPLKFSLGGDQGMDIFAAGSPASVRIACPSTTLDTIETTTSATANSLSYDAAADVYTFVWKTDKAWGGTCRELRVTFSDGTTETALFKFGK